MRHRLARIVAASALIVMPGLWLTAAPLVSAGDPCYHDFTMPASTTEQAIQIKLMPCAFAPTVTQVAVGSTVTFFNGPDFAHLITGANQAWGSRDTEVRPGATVSYTFAKAGVYPYACAIHRGMSGTILVGDVAAGTSAATTAGAAGTGAATPADTAGTAMDDVVVGAIGLGAGVLLGAAAVFVALRPRRTEDGAVRAPTA